MVTELCRLPDNEERLLAECEAVIERHLVKFMEVGKALSAINQGKLYRIKYGTFAAYCKGRWGIERSRAYQLLDATRIVAELEGEPEMSTRVDIFPENEKQVRPLVEKLKDPDDRRAAWKGAVEMAGGEQPSARQVREAVAIVKAQEPVKVAVPPSIEKEADRIVARYTPSELRSLIALIIQKGNLSQ